MRNWWKPLSAQLCFGFGVKHPTLSQLQHNPEDLFSDASRGVRPGSAKVGRGGEKHLEGSRIIFKTKVVKKHQITPFFLQSTFTAIVPRCKEAEAVLLSLRATQLVKYATNNRGIQPSTSSRSQIRRTATSDEDLLQEEGSALASDECPCFVGLKSTCEETTLRAEEDVVYNRAACC